MASSKKLVWLGLMFAAATVGSSVSIGAQIPHVREEVTVTGVRPDTEVDYYFSFNTPVALPGVALGTGTYLFRRITPDAIQVLSANRDRAYAMVHTIPTTRDTVTDRHQIVFGEASVSGAPHPIKAWFLPGREIGQELLYPKWQTGGDRAK